MRIRIIHRAKDHTEMHWIEHKTACGIKTPFATMDNRAVNCKKCNIFIRKGLVGVQEYNRPKELLQLRAA